MNFLDQLKVEILKSNDVLFHAYIPLASHCVKKNSRPIFRNQKTGRVFLGKSPALHSAEETIVTHFKSIKNRCHLLEPIKDPVWMMALFKFSHEQFYTKKGLISKNLPDQSNLYQLPEDCLQQAGVIVDDGQIYSHDWSRRLPWHETALEIFILRYSDTVLARSGTA